MEMKVKGLTNIPLKQTLAVYAFLKSLSTLSVTSLDHRTTFYGINYLPFSI